MADVAKTDDAEKAYAAAAEEVKPAKAKPVAKAPEQVAKAPEQVAEAPKKAPLAKAEPAVAPTKRAAPKTAKKAAPRKSAAVKKQPAAAKAAKVRKPIVRASAVRAAVKNYPTLTELKEAIMTKTTTDFAKPIADAFGEYQNRAKAAYDKGTVALTEVTEFAKGNVEAMVESGKILAGGVQDLGKTYVEEAKTAYETVTADVKEFAAVKSPTELFQLQGKIARRNFDAMIAAGTKNTDAVIKLANEVFAPITGRVTLATEKLANVA